MCNIPLYCANICSVIKSITVKGLIENLTGQYLDRIRLGGRLRTPGRIRTECGELPARQGEEIGGRK